MARAKPTVSRWKNRVLELREVRPSEMADHPHQWRTHPEAQKAAMLGVLDQIGIAGVGLAYHSPASGQLTSIDGHMRKSLGDVPWPTVILDVTDAEATALLGLFDPISAMASQDSEQLAALLKSLDEDMKNLAGLVYPPHIMDPLMAASWSPAAVGDMPRIADDEGDESAGTPGATLRFEPDEWAIVLEACAQWRSANNAAVVFSNERCIEAICHHYLASA